MKNKIAIITLLSFIAIIAINYFVYALLTQKIEGADVNLEARGIETPAKLFLGGYLGLFFGFKYLGTINWLLIPVALLYFFIVRPKLSREHKALLTVLLLSLGLIAAKGFFNQRYQLTLLPVVLFFLFLLTWKLFTYLKNPYYLREITILFLLANTLHFTWYTLYGSRAQEHMAKIFNTNTPKQPESTLYKQVPELSEYIDSVQNGNHTFLVNNLPDFYYRSGKKGLYYWCQDDFYYSNKGITRIFNNRDDEAVKHYLRDSLNCTYIYTMEAYNPYNKRFDSFLKTHCTLLVKDNENKQLFSVNE